MDYELFSFDLRLIRIKKQEILQIQIKNIGFMIVVIINYDLKDVENNYFDNSGGFCFKYYNNLTGGKYCNIKSEKYSSLFNSW